MRRIRPGIINLQFSEAIFTDKIVDAGEFGPGFQVESFDIAPPASEIRITPALSQTPALRLRREVDGCQERYPVSAAGKRNDSQLRTMVESFNGSLGR